jgi:hypothetical protein
MQWIKTHRASQSPVVLASADCDAFTSLLRRPTARANRCRIPQREQRTRINSTASKSDGPLDSVSVGRVRMKRWQGFLTSS